MEVFKKRKKNKALSNSNCHALTPRLILNFCSFDESYSDYNHSHPTEYTVLKNAACWFYTQVLLNFYVGIYYAEEKYCGRKFSPTDVMQRAYVDQRSTAACFYLDLWWFTVQGSLQVPWLSIAKSLPVIALAIAHFCNNWGYYTLLTCLPQYLKHILHFDIKSVSRYLIYVYILFLPNKHCLSGRAQTLSRYTQSRYIYVQPLDFCCTLVRR